MPRYTIIDEAGEDVTTLLAPADQISAFLVEGLTARLEDDYDISLDDALSALRRERDRRIAATDWAVQPGATRVLMDRIEYDIYRQRLRDLTETADPREPVWPVLQPIADIDPATLTPATRRMMIDAEKLRRTESRFYFAPVAGGTPSRFDFDPESRDKIAGAGTLAGLATGAGAPAGYLRWANADIDFVWIAADNSLHPMDAPTCFRFGQEAAAHISAHVFAAKALKDADPLPVDWHTDARWPLTPESGL